jgi:HD-GYP domain-containing protein (c-di-GMP phosphodiesterase class II)
MSAPVSLSTDVVESDTQGYLPIALGTLAPADNLDFDLFVRPDAGRPVLFRGRNYLLDDDDIHRLNDSATATLYIRVADHESYCDYLRDVVLEAPDLQPQQRFQVLTAVNRAVFETVFNSPSVQNYVEFAEEFGGQLADVVSNHDIALTELVKLLTHDYYTYTHVANVTTYCLALARGLGYAAPDELREIAIGALLHDYGKRHIPKAVLNNTGRLTEAEWWLIQQHPLTGFRDLCTRADLSWGQLMMVYQHHERLDGRGYPVGVGGSEVHTWARMCKVADVFDALTSVRPYRKSDPVTKVAELMQNRANVEFDAEMVRCFRAMLSCKS